jgi:hypothetical protein
LVIPNDIEGNYLRDLGTPLINSAVANGVKYIAFVGGFTLNDLEGMKLMNFGLLPAVNRLKQLSDEIGLKWTLLLGSCFMENILRSFKKIKATSTFVFPDVVTPWMATKDIGRSAAACLASGDFDKHNGKTYQISGPEILNGDQVAAVLSKVLGQEVKFHAMPREKIAQVMPAAVAEIYYCQLEKPNVTPLSDDVKNLTGSNTCLEDFVRSHASEFD